MSKRPIYDPSKPHPYYDGPMWHWFGLSYSNYLVIPRTLLCGMPVEWQEKMAALLSEASEVYDYNKIEDRYTVLLRGSDGRIKTDSLSNYRHPPELPYRDEDEAA